MPQIFFRDWFILGLFFFWFLSILIESIYIFLIIFLVK